MTTRRRVLTVVAAAVALGLVVVGIVLIVTGDDDPAPTAPTTTAPAKTSTRATLPLDDTSQAALAKLTGLSFPAGTADFLSTHLDDGSQLDLTFTIPTAARAAFVTGSGLPALEDGRRVVTHSSPLWKLNPEGKIAGATDRHGTVVRAVELVPEGNRLRARVVISPAGS
jgi:hypothetical protein